MLKFAAAQVAAYQTVILSDDGSLAFRVVYCPVVFLSRILDDGQDINLASVCDYLDIDCKESAATKQSFVCVFTATLKKDENGKSRTSLEKCTLTVARQQFKAIGRVLVDGFNGKGIFSCFYDEKMEKVTAVGPRFDVDVLWDHFIWYYTVPSDDHSRKQLKRTQANASAGSGDQDDPFDDQSFHSSRVLPLEERKRRNIFLTPSSTATNSPATAAAESVPLAPALAATANHLTISDDESDDKFVSFELIPFLWPKVLVEDSRDCVIRVYSVRKYFDTLLSPDYNLFFSRLPALKRDFTLVKGEIEAIRTPKRMVKSEVTELLVTITSCLCAWTFMKILFF